MFSSRQRTGAGRNRLARAVDERRQAGRPILDLTLSNPTKAGLVYPPDLLYSLSDPRALVYEPAPFGLVDARRAVSADFARRGIAVLPERLILTASTSEAYSLLFKLLCDPGDIVMAPRPSYPLIEHLTDLDGVALEPYNLDEHGAWSIDVSGLTDAISAMNRDARKTRAVVVISPNNPTGSMLSVAEACALRSLACANDIALIVDEVFADYVFDAFESAPPIDFGDALTFRLGGLSKTVGLPQVKLAWIAVSGPSVLVELAMDRLETIADTYLSVSTPVQVAAADLLREGAGVRREIQQRVERNLDRLKAALPAHPSCSLLPPQGGWYAVLRVPAVKPEESMVLDLLDRTGVLVHPGYFFDFQREAFLVISLLPEPATFDQAVEHVFSGIERS